MNDRPNQVGEPMTDQTRDIVERLRDGARHEEVAHKMMADAKTARQTDRDDAWTEAGYDWLRAEQTTQWKAADHIEALTKRVAELEEALTKARAKLRGAVEPDDVALNEEIDAALSNAARGEP